MRYRVVIPNWYEGVLTCEDVNNKEVVIHAPETMTWAVGKPLTEVLFLYRYLGRNNGGTVVEPVGKPTRKIKVVRKKRTVKIVRKRKP